MITTILLIYQLYSGMSKYQFLLQNPSATPKGVLSDSFTVNNRSYFFRNDTLASVKTAKGVIVPLERRNGLRKDGKR